MEEAEFKDSDEALSCLFDQLLNLTRIQGGVMSLNGETWDQVLQSVPLRVLQKYWGGCCCIRRRQEQTVEITYLTWECVMICQGEPVEGAKTLTMTWT